MLRMARSERLAIIIASKNRADDLRRALFSISEQEVLPDDVVVVDQSDEPYDLSSFQNVRHIYDPSIGSLTVARNRGIDVVNATRVLFVDDDVKLRPQTIAALHAAFDNFPEAVGFQCDDVEHHSSGRLNAVLEAVFQHGFVDMDAVHALAAERREQGGVEVH